MAELARHHGFPLVNVFDYSTLEVDAEGLVELQQRLGVTAIEMPWPRDPEFRLGAADPHLNRAGNAAITRVLIDRLGELGICLP